MIASRTIQNDGNRKYNVSLVLLSHNEENDHKVGFRDIKRRNEIQNWNLCEKLSKIGPIEFFLLWLKSTVAVNGQQQQLKSSQKLAYADVNMLTSREDILLTSLGQMW